MLWHATPKKLLVLMTGTLVVLGVLALAVLSHDGWGMTQIVSSLRYGNGTVWYEGREYVYPSKELTAAQLEHTYFHNQAPIDTGDKVIGLSVYDTASRIAFEHQYRVSPTLLFLKKPDGNFIVYALSGGP